MSKLLFHIVGAIQFGFGCYYDYMYVVIPESSKAAPSFGGKFKFLTYINACIQTLYFILAVGNDLFGSNEPTPTQKPLIRRIKDAIFSSLAFPVSMFVAVSFWALYAVDRELILPRSLDPYFPSWLNHIMHTNIAIFILIELATTFRMYPKRKTGMTILTVFMLAYLTWVHVIWYETGMWVYPVLKVLSWPLRVVFYLVCLLFVFSFYTLGERVNATIWSTEVEKTVKSGKKKAK